MTIVFDYIKVELFKFTIFLDIKEKALLFDLRNCETELSMNENSSD